MSVFRIQRARFSKTWLLFCRQCGTYEALENHQQGFRVAKVHHDWWHKPKPVETVGYWHERMYG